MIPIYPVYDLYDQGYYTKIQTQIRLQRKSDGKWFLVPVIISNEYPRTSTAKQRRDGLIQTIKQFHAECYKCILFYIIPEEELKDPAYGSSISGKEDPSQISEKERLGIGL